MPTHIVMPQLGESVVEGTVGKWMKQVGDAVKQYEPIMEVITDKVTTEIPSPGEGTLLQILVAEGITVKAGTVVGVIGARQSDVISEQSPVSNLQSPVSGEQSPVSNLPSSSRNRLTPVVARMMAEFNITTAELATIQGTGEGGRISKKDLEKFIAARESKPIAPPLTVPAVSSPAQTAIPPLADKAQEIVPLTPMRRAIAEHMARSKQTIPHVTSIHEADMTRVMAHQNAQQAEFLKRGVKLTYTAYFAQAAIAALQTMPFVNARFTEQGIVMNRAVNLGIAVALEDGLIVPVIKNAGDLSLLALARAVNDVAGRARDKKLAPEEVQGATFTLTNFGIFGSLFGTPIIPYGTTAILGVGAIQKRVVVLENDAMAIRPMVYLGLTFDHRLLDASAGDRFMQTFTAYLEAYA